MPVEKTQLFAMMMAARDARDKAYAPYSQFQVGAAVLGGSGKVYIGCNVENASYGLTMCAERVAIFKAVSEGETIIKAVAIAAGESEIARPCGACLQVTSEFSDPSDPTVILASSLDGSYDIHTINDYLPMQFQMDKQSNT